MTKGVGANCLLQSDFFGKPFDHQKDHHSGELATSSIKEDVIFKSFLDGHVHTNFIHIDFHILHGISTNGYKPFFVALSQHSQEADIKINVRQTKIDQLSYSQP